MFSHGEFNLFLVFSISCKLEVRFRPQVKHCVAEWLNDNAMCFISQLIRGHIKLCHPTLFPVYHLDKVMTAISHHLKSVFFPVRVLNNFGGYFGINLNCFLIPFTE